MNNIIFKNFPVNTNNLRIYSNDNLISNSNPVAVHDNLNYGPNSDAIIMNNRADVKLTNSEFNINFKLPVTNGGSVDLWLPVSNPKFVSTNNGIYNGIFDKNNFLKLPDINFKLELVNTKVPFWWIGLQNINASPTATPTYIKLNEVPDAVIDIVGENLRGDYALPGTHLGSENTLPPNTSKCFGNTCLQTFDNPAGIYAWGLYLWGENTDVNVNGKSYIPEIVLHSGKVKLFDKTNNFECNFPATSGRVAYGGKIYIEGCNVGAPDIYNTLGDLSSDGAGSEIIICKSNLNNLNIRSTNGGKIKIYQAQTINSNVYWDKTDVNIIWSDSNCPFTQSEISDPVFIPQSALTETPNPSTGLKVFDTTDYSLILKDDRLIQNNSTAACDFRMKEVTAVDSATDSTLGYNNVTTTSIVALNNGGSFTTDAQKYFRVNCNPATGASIKFPANKQARTDYNIQIRCKRNNNNQWFARDQKVNFNLGAYSVVTVEAINL